MDWDKFVERANPTPDCPLCGSFGEEVFNLYRCSNPLCRNFPRPPARDPEPETKDLGETIDVIDLPAEGPIGIWDVVGGGMLEDAFRIVNRGRATRFPLTAEQKAAIRRALNPGPPINPLEKDQL